MSKVCDVCGTEEGVQCEILTKGEAVDRIYHLCPKHWTEVYRRALEDFTEGNEYKSNSYVKMIADRLIVDAHHTEKAALYLDEEGVLDIDSLEPVEIKRLRPYEDDSNEEGYEETT